MKWKKSLIEKGAEILEKIDFSISTPNKNNVLNFLKMDPKKIKIAIIGQDPYPGKGVANGYAFAVNKDQKIPSSLRNIFKEIKEVQGYLRADKTLEHWKSQGVLLLNGSLTTEIGRPNAHKHLWSSFVVDLISWLDQNYPDITWVIWGKEAEKITSCIKGRKIIDAHPSPLSYSRRKKHTFKILNKIDW